MSKKKKIALITGAIFLFMVVLGALVPALEQEQTIAAKRCTSPEEETYISKVNELEDSIKASMERSASLAQSVEGAYSSQFISEARLVKAQAEEIIALDIPESLLDAGLILRLGYKRVAYAMDLTLEWTESGDIATLNFSTEELRASHSLILRAGVTIIGYCEGVLDEPTLRSSSAQ